MKVRAISWGRQPNSNSNSDVPGYHNNNFTIIQTMNIKHQIIFLPKKSNSTWIYKNNVMMFVNLLHFSTRFWGWMDVDLWVHPLLNCFFRTQFSDQLFTKMLPIDCGDDDNDDNFMRIVRKVIKDNNAWALNSWRAAKLISKKGSLLSVSASLLRRHFVYSGPHAVRCSWNLRNTCWELKWLKCWPQRW